MTQQPIEGTQNDIEGLDEYLQEMSSAFDKLCQMRHDEGAKEYGTFTFLENDVTRMMMEELADTSNYCRMQFIKLSLLQDMLSQDLEALTDAEGNIKVGFKAFRGTAKNWDKL